MKLGGEEAHVSGMHIRAADRRDRADRRDASRGPRHAGLPAFKEVQFSEMQRPTMERKWTAVVSVDASRCATTAGSFEIVFLRQKETGFEVEFREQFIWRSPAVTVAVDFWADEAVEGYWIHNVAPCPCRT